MRAILYNPYRTVGLLVGATTREQERQIKRLKQFIEAEQNPEDDFSFPTLGKLPRTIENVNDAASKLNLDGDKMNAALFWFYKGNDITDEPALDSLKEDDQQRSIDIWTKQISNGVVTQRNSSAFLNLSTLLLCKAINGSINNVNFLEQGVSLKLKFLESDFIKDFKALATDETYKTTKKELQLLFLNQLYSEIERDGGISFVSFLEIINKQQFSAKEVFLKGFAEKPIERIERKIQEIRKKQNENKEKAGDLGNELYNATKNDLTQVISVLGSSDINVISVSDKLATEILQCAVTLFNHFHETETEVGEVALELNKKAKSIALGGVLKDRINENASIFERYINDRPDREKQKLFGEDLKLISAELEKFQTLQDSVNNAVDFANYCKPYLNNIKLKLGIADELYVAISTTVARNVQGMIISSLNESMDKRNKFVEYQNNLRFTLKYVEYAEEYPLEKLKDVIESAWKATILLKSFDMDNVQRERYFKNKESLKQIYKQVFDGIVFISDTPIEKWLLWVGGILIFLLLVFAIGGSEAISGLFTIIFIIGIFLALGWLRSGGLRR